MGSDQAEALENGDNYIPSKKIKITIDSAEALSNNILPDALKSNMVSTLTFDLNKESILKNDFITLDIIAQNISKRPICFAITVSPDSFLGLEKYFMQTGMVYRLTPAAVNGRGYNREIVDVVSYDLLIENASNFSFGGIEDGNEMNLDPSSLGSAMTAKYVMYQQLAANLVQGMIDNNAQIRALQADEENSGFAEVVEQLEVEAEDKKQKALTVLDKMLELFPSSTLPYDYNMVNAASYYQLLGNNEKSLTIIKELSETVLDDLRYYYYLYNKPDDGYIARQQYASDQRDAERCAASMISIANKAGDTELSENIQKSWEMLRAEYNIQGNEQQRPPTAP